MIHSRQIYRSPEGGIVAVKEGFNFHAFLFHGPWCLVNRLYFAGSIGIGALLALLFLPKEQTLIAFMALFALMLVYGTLGNLWLIRHLQNHQHRHLGTLKAPHKRAAELEAKNFYTA